MYFFSIYYNCHDNLKNIYTTFGINVLSLMSGFVCTFFRFIATVNPFTALYLGYLKLNDLVYLLSQGFVCPGVGDFTDGNDIF